MIETAWMQIPLTSSSMSDGPSPHQVIETAIAQVRGCHQSESDGPSPHQVIETSMTPLPAGAGPKGSDGPSPHQVIETFVLMACFRLSLAVRWTLTALGD